MTYYLLNRYISGHLVLVLVSTGLVMMCSAIENPTSCEIQAVVRFLKLKTWALRKSIVNSSIVATVYGHKAERNCKTAV
jgi:hypothetical protein